MNFSVRLLYESHCDSHRLLFIMPLSQDTIKSNKAILGYISFTIIMQKIEYIGNWHFCMMLPDSD